MNRWVAFLRGVNVGGRHLVKMDAVRRAFESEGLDRVSTFKASGNVLFDAPGGARFASPPRLTARLDRLAGGPVEVIYRSAGQLREILQLDPFPDPLPPAAVAYLTMFVQPPSDRPQTPFASPRSDVEVLLMREGDAFSLARSVGGRSGFPNKFLEDRFKTPATTRNWATINGVVQALAPTTDHG